MTDSSRSEQMTQTETVLRHLETCGGLTSWEAMRDYGIMRLASRVSDLKKLGVPVRSETVHDTNRFGEKIHYSRYFLEETNGS